MTPVPAPEHCPQPRRRRFWPRANSRVGRAIHNLQQALLAHVRDPRLEVLLDGLSFACCGQALEEHCGDPLRHRNAVNALLYSLIDWTRRPCYAYQTVLVNETWYEHRRRRQPLPRSEEEARKYVSGCVKVERTRGILVCSPGNRGHAHLFAVARYAFAEEGAGKIRTQIEKTAEGQVARVLSNHPDTLIRMLEGARAELYNGIVRALASTPGSRRDAQLRGFRVNVGLAHDLLEDVLEVAEGYAELDRMLNPIPDDD
jgi:hypothetical protein